MSLFASIALSLFLGSHVVAASQTPGQPGAVAPVAMQATRPVEPPVFGQFAPLAVDVQPNDQALATLLIGQQTLQKLTGGVGGPLPRVESEPRSHPLRTAAILAAGGGLALLGLQLVRRGRQFVAILVVATGSAVVVGVAVANQAAPARPQRPQPGQAIVIQIGEGDQVRLVLDRVSLDRLNELAKARENERK